MVVAVASPGGLHGDPVLCSVWVCGTSSVRSTNSFAIIGTSTICSWIVTLRTWQRDESEDMAHTMAVLDKNLRRAERLRLMLPSALHRRRTEDPQPNAAPT